MTNARVLLDGLRFPESPRWHDGRYWVADWHAREIHAVAPSGERAPPLAVPSSPISFDWTPDGHLVVVSGGGAALLRQGPDGALAPFADLSAIMAEPWNEIVVDGLGRAYVNSVGFDFPGEPPPGDGHPGVVALVTPDGPGRLVADDLAFPNGMAVTPDGATLLVAESWGRRLTAFDVEPDGSLANRRVWAEVDGFPDGICLDADGAVWYADVPNQRCVRVAEGGAVLDTVASDRGCFACMLGGPDRQTLFVATNEWGGPEAMAHPAPRGRLVAVEAPAGGAGWPATGQAHDASPSQNAR